MRVSVELYNGSGFREMVGAVIAKMGVEWDFSDQC
jgi:hypothetical protein